MLAALVLDSVLLVQSWIAAAESPEKPLATLSLGPEGRICRPRSNFNISKFRALLQNQLGAMVVHTLQARDCSNSSMSCTLVSSRSALFFMVALNDTIALSSEKHASLPGMLNFKIYRFDCLTGRSGGTAIAVRCHFKHSWVFVPDLRFFEAMAARLQMRGLPPSQYFPYMLRRVARALKLSKSRRANHMLHGPFGMVYNAEERVEVFTDHLGDIFGGAQSDDDD